MVQATKKIIEKVGYSLQATSHDLSFLSRNTAMASVAIGLTSTALEFGSGGLSTQLSASGLAVSKSVSHLQVH